MNKRVSRRRRLVILLLMSRYSDDTLYVVADVPIYEGNLKKTFRPYGKISWVKLTNTERNCALVRMDSHRHAARVLAAYYHNNMQFPCVAQMRYAVDNRSWRPSSSPDIDHWNGLTQQLTKRERLPSPERAAKRARTQSPPAPVTWTRIPSVHIERPAPEQQPHPVVPTPAPVAAAVPSVEAPALLFFSQHKNASEVPLYAVEVYSPFGKSEEMMRIDPTTYWQVIRPILRGAGTDAALSATSDMPFYIVEARDPDGTVTERKRVDPTTYWRSITPVLRHIEVDAALMLNGAPPTVLATGAAKV